MKSRIINFLLFIFFLLSYFLILSKLKFKCLFKHLLNIYCPGCGTTRMINSIFKFELYQAFRYNPLFFILFIIFIPYTIYIIFIYLKKGIIKLPSIKFILILIIIIIIYTIFRNIPEFIYLTPTKIM